MHQFGDWEWHQTDAVGDQSVEHPSGSNPFAAFGVLSHASLLRLVQRHRTVSKSAAARTPPFQELEEEEKRNVLNGFFTLQQVAQKILSGDIRKIVVCVGAGISRSAGIPDFRSESSSIFGNDKFLEEFNLPSREAVFDLEYFLKDPRPFFSVAQRVFFSKDITPTPTHHFIRMLEMKGLLLRLYSQNIDMLEGEAGLCPERVIYAHGNFSSGRCVRCHRIYPHACFRPNLLSGTVPTCSECHARRNAAPASLHVTSPKPSHCAPVPLLTVQATPDDTGGPQTDLHNFRHTGAGPAPGSRARLLSLEAAGPPGCGVFKKSQSEFALAARGGQESDADSDSDDNADADHNQVRHEDAPGGAAGRPRSGSESEGRCSGVVKPDVVMFGEDLPRSYYEHVDADLAKCQLLLVIGTSLNVHPFADVIHKVGPRCIRVLINREEVGADRSSLLGALNRAASGFRFGCADNYRDVRWLGDSDQAVRQLAQLLHWERDLDSLIASSSDSASVALSDSLHLHGPLSPRPKPSPSRPSPHTRYARRSPKPSVADLMPSPSLPVQPPAPGNPASTPGQACAVSVSLATATSTPTTTHIPAASLQLPRAVATDNPASSTSSASWTCSAAGTTATATHSFASASATAATTISSPSPSASLHYSDPPSAAKPANAAPAISVHKASPTAPAISVSGAPAPSPTNPNLQVASSTRSASEEAQRRAPVLPAGVHGAVKHLDELGLD